jgi:hypothetical protein
MTREDSLLAGTRDNNIVSVDQHIDHHFLVNEKE